jgi:hypothetical protein
MKHTLIDTYAQSAASFNRSGAAREPRAQVPCNGCTSCCERELLFLHPEMGDKPEEYETQEVLFDGEPVLILKHKPNGNCWYLGEHGCTIHDRAPAICQEFDCRRLFLAFHRDYNHAQRRKIVAQGALTKDVLNAGKERLNTLPSYLRVLDPLRRRARPNAKLGRLVR